MPIVSTSQFAQDSAGQDQLSQESAALGIFDSFVIRLQRWSIRRMLARCQQIRPARQLLAVILRRSANTTAMKRTRCSGCATITWKISLCTIISDCTPLKRPTILPVTPRHPPPEAISEHLHRILLQVLVTLLHPFPYFRQSCQSTTTPFPRHHPRTRLPRMTTAVEGSLDRAVPPQTRATRPCPTKSTRCA